VEWQSVEDAAAAVGYAKSMERGTVADPTSLPTRYDKPPYEPEQMTGRWPANVLLDDEAGPMLDEQADTGGVSRFFYCAKASRAERDAGLAGVTPKPLHWSSGSQSPGTFQSPGTDRTARNNHPTVKPVALIRYLTRLVTPPGGTVLDPFMGSGTTGVACADEGFNFIGIEREAEYVEVARRRIEAAQAQQRLFA
jgi:site-specific DNA-methyltransferase (adenine-specific)